LASAGSQARPQDIELQAAIRTETIDGNPKAAAEQFKAIAARYSGDRAVVALALVHLAECYRKLGDQAARDVYARVVRDYADQNDAVQLARSRLASSEANGAPVRLIWSLHAATSVASRVSWNGRWVAYVDWTDAGAGDLFLRDLFSGSERRLTRTRNRLGTSRNAFVGGAAISRDGSRIAYEWRDGDRAELRFLLLQSPAVPPRVLERDPSVASVDPRDWTPDGRWIAGLWRRKDQALEIGLISTTDGSLRPLKVLDQACACAGNVAMSVSPDGRYLAYHMPAAQTRTRDIYVVPTTGGAAMPAVEYRGDDALVGWAPDGRSIVFMSDRTGSAGVWAVAFKNGLTASPAPLKLNIGAFAPLGIASTGAVFGCRCEPEAGSDIKIASLDFSTGRFLSLPTDAVQEYVGTNSQPFWSNDGRYFLYRSVRQNQDPLLAIRSADTLALVRELRPKLSMISDPRWSPDDKTIAVIARDFENKFGYYRIDVETGKTAPIILYPSPGNRMGPMGPESSWSADGRKFYFRRTKYTPDGPDLESVLVEVAVMTGEERILVESASAREIRAVLSTDTRTLYYLRAAPGTSEVGLIALTLATGAEREVIRRANIASVNRSPDGKWLGLTIEPTAANPSIVLLVPTGSGDPVELWRAPSTRTLGAPREQVQGAGVWAADSRSLISRRTMGTNPPQFWWVPIDGMAGSKLDEFTGSVPAGLRVHPDGKRLLFGATVAGAPTQSPKPTEIWIWEDLLVTGVRR
jgi:Tol biopolymer transport system component